LSDRYSLREIIWFGVLLVVGVVLFLLYYFWGFGNHLT